MAPCLLLGVRFVFVSPLLRSRSAPNPCAVGRGPSEQGVQAVLPLSERPPARSCSVPSQFAACQNAACQNAVSQG